MQLVIQLREDVALGVKKRLVNNDTVQEVNQEVQSLLNLTSKFGVKLESIHPNSIDPLLTNFFMIVVTDQELANRIIECLKQFTIVEAAYLKPDYQLP